MRKLFVFLSIFSALNLFAQELSKAEINDFKNSGKELISYFTFTLNSIGDNELSPKEKDIIISNSFIKMFRDDKVQIEDDLDTSRETVTNKDVQAYLKDVDFFFKYANFTYNILSVDLQMDENGKPYLLANVLRTLKAIDLKGDTIKNDQQRFFEIDLNSEKRELKIASIYTTKLNENEENIRWWNQLPIAWKTILGSNFKISDSLVFSSIYLLNNNYYILQRQKTKKPDIEKNINSISSLDQLPIGSDIVFGNDTIWLNDSSRVKKKEALFSTLSQILEIKDLDLSGNLDISDLEPISRLSNLRTLNISFTQIKDIYPVRNLTKLHSLDCSNTSVNSVDPLIYSMELSILHLPFTKIRTIEALANLDKLLFLDISETEINNLDACKEMNLLELKMRNTFINDLSPLNSQKSLNYLDLSNNQQLKSLEDLNQLNHLKVLWVNNTMVKDLTPLSKLENLETLYCENTAITSLSGLEQLPNLKKIYCDNSLLGRQKAIDFMKEHPHILVVYESKQLQLWWDELPQVWKKVFAEKVALDSIPSKEQLHELTTIKEINLSGNNLITSLLPLDKLKNLQILNADKTSINNLDGISETREMRKLDISNTNIEQLSAIENLNLIEELALSNCPIKDLHPLLGMANLIKLSIDNTHVDKLTALENLQNLRYLYADNTKINHKQFDDFIELKQDIHLVYQSNTLIAWWNNLSDPWKNIFMKQMRWTYEPNAEELHILIQIQSIEITENRMINDLGALDKFTHLRILKVNDTKITNVSPLINLSYLEEIDLSRNPIIDLSPLQKLTNLKIIYLNNTPIDNLEWLLGLPQIKILDISGTEIKNLKELNNAIHLEILYAYNTKIRNIKPLENLHNLILLKIYNSKVSANKVASFKQINPKCAVDWY